MSYFSERIKEESYLALPNGLDRVEVAEPVGVGPILGDDNGLGVLDPPPPPPPPRGRSSNLRLPICGVGGVELLAIPRTVSVENKKNYETHECHEQAVSVSSRFPRQDPVGDPYLPC